VRTASRDCDDKQLLCFALALWNGSDPILKERAFGLTNGKGNHRRALSEGRGHGASTRVFERRRLVGLPVISLR
jgi:hypothetical protein